MIKLIGLHSADMQCYMLIIQEITQFSKPLHQKRCCHNTSMRATLGRVCHHIYRLDERERATCDDGMACKVLELKMKSVSFFERAQRRN